MAGQENQLTYQLILFNPSTRQRGAINVSMYSHTGLETGLGNIRTEINFQLRPGCRYSQSIPNIGNLEGFRALLMAIYQEAACIFSPVVDFEGDEDGGMEEY